MALIDDVEALVRRRSLLTAVEIAEALFPDDPYQQRVNPTLVRLMKQGRLIRHGRGGIGDPFRYSPD
jgi:hypothetical protein